MRIHNPNQNSNPVPNTKHTQTYTYTRKQQNPVRDNKELSIQTSLT
jgi:hypothetical protein